MLKKLFRKNRRKGLDVSHLSELTHTVFCIAGAAERELVKALSKLPTRPVLSFRGAAPIVQSPDTDEDTLNVVILELSPTHDAASNPHGPGSLIVWTTPTDAQPKPPAYAPSKTTSTPFTSFDVYARLRIMEAATLRLSELNKELYGLRNG